MFCFDFARPKRDQMTSTIHSFERETFLHEKHCIGLEEAEIGDIVYWVILTRHAVIFKNVSTPGSRMKRVFKCDVYVPVARAALVEHCNNAAASKYLEIPLEFIESMFREKNNVTTARRAALATWHI